MAKTDVFNPKRGRDPQLGFNANWNYGSPRKIGSNFQTQRPRWGRWSTRSVGDAGYGFNLQFVDRSIETVRYVRNFYEQFQTGYFTLIDHDNGEREHAGRFTSYSDDTQTANGKYTINAVFEEIPGCPMRTYPKDWDKSSHWIDVVDGFGHALVGTDSGAWVYQPDPRSSSGTIALDNPSAILAAATPLGFRPQLFLPDVVGGNFAQAEYAGWGFRMTLPVAGFLAFVDVVLDGTTIVHDLDLYSGVWTGLPNAVVTGGAGQPVTIVKEDVPLGRHRVKLIATGQIDPSASGNGMIFPPIKVMH